MRVFLKENQPITIATMSKTKIIAIKTVKILIINELTISEALIYNLTILQTIKKGAQNQAKTLDLSLCFFF